MPDLRIQNLPVPADLAAPLREFAGDSGDGPAVRRHLEADGYVLLRGVLDRGQVAEARGEVFRRLETVGEVGPPASEGIATGQSRRRELPDLKAFWRSISEGPALRRVTHGPRLRAILSTVLGEPARPHDLIYLRPTPIGRSTRLHYDYPFFASRSTRIHTAWVPLGPVPVTDGPLLIVEGSHHFTDLIGPLRDHDYTADHANEVVQKAAYEKVNEVDPMALARGRGVRLLTADFRPGDLVVFGGFTLHGSFDNTSPVGRIRLSCDVRYQPAADPDDDDRYFGPDPQGSKGGGYGDMRGAQPLDGQP